MGVCLRACTTSPALVRAKPGICLELCSEWATASVPSDASSAAGQSTDCIDRDVESNRAGVHCGQSALRDNRAWHPRSRSEPERLVPRKDRREAPKLVRYAVRYD